MARKTVTVDYIREMTNSMLANGKGTAQERKAVMIFLEDILHKTGNYKGFYYLGVDSVPEGHLPGRNETGDIFANCDKTRVHYF